MSAYDGADLWYSFAEAHGNNSGFKQKEQTYVCTYDNANSVVGSIILRVMLRRYKIESLKNI